MPKPQHDRIVQAAENFVVFIRPSAMNAKSVLKFTVKEVFVAVPYTPFANLEEGTSSSKQANNSSLSPGCTARYYIKLCLGSK